MDTASNVSVRGSVPVIPTKDQLTIVEAGCPADAPFMDPQLQEAVPAKSSSPAPSEPFDVAFSKTGSPIPALSGETDSNITPAPTADPEVTRTHSESQTQPAAEEQTKGQQGCLKPPATQDQQATAPAVGGAECSLTGAAKKPADQTPAAKSG
ncbi:uncharacterized protein LOC144125900 [Amblyomma americanum]